MIPVLIILLAIGITECIPLGDSTWRRVLYGLLALACILALLAHWGYGLGTM